MAKSHEAGGAVPRVDWVEGRRIFEPHAGETRLATREAVEKSGEGMKAGWGRNIGERENPNSEAELRIITVERLIANRGVCPVPRRGAR